MNAPIALKCSLTAFAALLTGCAPLEATRVDTIELHHSGWFAYNVVVHADGRGIFDANPHNLKDYVPPFPEKGRKAFKITPGEFKELKRSLNPYLRTAKPITEQSLMDIIEGKVGCEPGQPMGQDFGALYLRWQGPKLNVHTIVEFGCDPLGRAEEYARLQKAVERLPLERFLGD